MRGHNPLEAQVVESLADPAHQGHPLHETLSQLWEAHHNLLNRIERIARVSDGYQSIARDRELTLSARFDKQLRQLEKVARISDRYQMMMHDLIIALREASTHDALTGIANRRLLTERLREETERARRYERPLCVAIVDIDYFKVVNDDHGHEIGDSVLIEVVQVMEAQIREHDLCGRWGGEEFLIVMPETSTDNAILVLERLRQAVEALRVHIRDKTLTVTVSLGLAELRTGESYSSAINRADTALLRAKRNGRNRYERAD
ncbi:biofilm regulation diguanylate cyclase SiaD [Stutzerimonas marianensis]